MEKVLLTLIVAGMGGLIGIKLNIPAGAMIGSMVAVIVLNVSSGKAYIPENFKLVAQMVVGGVIGLRFTRESIADLKEMIVPAIILMIGLLALCVILGYIIHKTTGLDLTTALFSTSPGGIADMSIIAEAYGADVRKVVALHMVRLVSVITLLPIIIKFLVEKIL